MISLATFDKFFVNTHISYFFVVHYYFYRWRSDVWNPLTYTRVDQDHNTNSRLGYRFRFTVDSSLECLCLIISVYSSFLRTRVLLTYWWPMRDL